MPIQIGSSQDIANIRALATFLASKQQGLSSTERLFHKYLVQRLKAPASYVGNARYQFVIATLKAYHCEELVVNKTAYPHTWKI